MRAVHLNQTFAHLLMSNDLSISDSARRVSQSHYFFEIMHRVFQKKAQMKQTNIAKGTTDPRVEFYLPN